MIWNFDFLGEPDYAGMYDKYCLEMDKQFMADEQLARYLISFDDDGCLDPGQGVCEMNDGEPDVGLSPGCERCYHKHTEEQIRNLDEVDWLILSAVVDAPEHILASGDGLNQEALSRLTRVGYVWPVHKAVWASPNGIAALREYRKPFDPNDIPF